MSRRDPPFSRPQKAMRCPCGDQAGWTASSPVRRRVRPSARLTGEELARVGAVVGRLEDRSRSRTRSRARPATTTDSSPDRRCGARTRPSTLMTKRPPPSRDERKAIEPPSGENAGCTSSPAHAAVRLIARWLPDALQVDVPALRPRAPRRRAAGRRATGSGRTPGRARRSPRRRCPRPAVSEAGSVAKRRERRQQRHGHAPRRSRSRASARGEREGAAREARRSSSRSLLTSSDDW